MNKADPDKRRHESDREDIMREATGMRRRVSLSVQGLPEPIVAGFRSNGFFSIYFDQDPVYQFNDQGQLRRAYRGGFLFRTQGTTLAKLERVRTETQTVLQRTDLNSIEFAKFLAEMKRFLRQLCEAGSANNIVVHEVIPTESELLPKVLTASELALDCSQPLADALPTRRK